MSWLFGSRRRVCVSALGLLLALDVGRSIFARLGYAHPTSTWQPDPAVYADLTWPPGADLGHDVSLGRRVYAQRCAVCHGPDGRGNGPAAPSLIPRPRDFTAGQFKYKSTAAGRPPTDADLVHVVANGLPASAMPYWRDILDTAALHAVVAYVKSMSPVFGGRASAPLAVPPRVAPTPTSIARGRALFTAKGCVACHGPDGRARLVLKDAKGYPVVSRDVTAPWTFRGGSEPEQIWLRLTTGLAPGPMPSYAAITTAADRWDLVNYVVSLARIAPWAPGGKLDGPGQEADHVQRGAYLVRAEMCGLCHTTINRTGIYRADDFYLAGGMRVGIYPHGMYVSRNLTSDRASGVGTWTEAQIANAIRNGRSPKRLLSPHAMPWIFLHALTQDDALAIASYLKTLPAVRNEVPGPLHYGVVETVVAKVVAGLPAAGPTLLSYADGNFGQTTAGLARDLGQRILVAAQWLVLLLGAVLFYFAGPPERRLPRGARGWLTLGAASAGIVLLGVIGGVLYATPTLRVIPPEQIAGPIAQAVPQPSPAALGSPERAALAARGRYVFTVASCAICHGADGSGGLKISWAPFGTLWVRNISPDSATGIGTWSDAEIGRAIRAGVSRDGRALHWQGMIWDHASNWDEEDIRAVIAYLRALPPVHHAVPAPRAPAPDDCAVYSFWVAPSAAPGCR
ncbi:MAG TPA: c-type cytochrome [Gemmatimonadales bacterium]|nr:c-type cytochrome [Gemmatimonadales bacterium]